MANKFTPDQQAAISDTANAVQVALALVTYLLKTQRDGLTDVETTARELRRASAALAQLRGEKGGTR